MHASSVYFQRFLDTSAAHQREATQKNNHLGMWKSSLSQLEEARGPGEKVHDEHLIQPTKK